MIKTTHYDDGDDNEDDWKAPHLRPLAILAGTGSGNGMMKTGRNDWDGKSWGHHDYGRDGECGLKNDKRW